MQDHVFQTNPSLICIQLCIPRCGYCLGTEPTSWRALIYWSRLGPSPPWAGPEAPEATTGRSCRRGRSCFRRCRWTRPSPDDLCSLWWFQTADLRIIELVSARLSISLPSDVRSSFRWYLWSLSGLNGILSLNHAMVMGLSPMALHWILASLPLRTVCTLNLFSKWAATNWLIE